MDDIVDISDLDVIDWLYSQIPTAVRSNWFMAEEGKTVQLVHYRDDSTRYEIGEATITDSPHGLIVRGQVKGEPMGGIVQNSIEVDELEFPQPGLVLDDPQKQLHFMAKIARDHHASKTDG